MIDKNKLRELANDSTQTSESISQALGLGAVHNLYYNLGLDPELKAIFKEGRDAVRASRNASKSSKKTAPRKPSTSTPPPRKSNTNGKSGVSELLLRKIAHEFEHIKIYEEISERFDEIATELRQSL